MLLSIGGIRSFAVRAIGRWVSSGAIVLVWALCLPLWASAPLTAASRATVSDGLIASLAGGELVLEATPLRAEGLLAFARRLCGSDEMAPRISAANNGARKLLMGVRYRVPFELLRPELQMQVVRALDEADITPDDLEMHKPTLDEVFLTLTGHVAEDTAEAEDDAAPPAPGRSRFGRRSR